MLRIFKNKFFILFLTTMATLIIVVVSVNLDNKVSWLNNIVNVPSAPIQKFFAFTSGKFEGISAFFKDTKAVIDENKMLKEKIDQLENENRQLKEYEQENQELRDALNLKDQFNDYEPIGANIIAKDAGNWFNMFVTDRGSSSGVSKNFPVISNKGLVGMVVEAGPFSSKIITITDPDSIVSARISKSGVDSVIIKGDIKLKDLGLCRLERIPPDAEISFGDTIETSGLGGIFPRGIAIGKVKEIKKTNSELSRYAIIEPSVDFKKLSQVFILKAKGNKNTELGSVEK